MFGENRPEQYTSATAEESEKKEQEVSLEQLQEWKGWMDEDLQKLIADEAKRVSEEDGRREAELTGLELREFLAKIDRVKELEEMIGSGSLCYGGKKNIYAVHDIRFDNMHDEAEGRGFSFAYHEVKGGEDGEHKKSTSGEYAEVPDGNGDFSLMYKSDSGKEVLVVDTDGHGVYADAASRLTTLYLELSRKVYAESKSLDVPEGKDPIEVRRESAILNAALGDTDRFISKLSIKEDRKPASLVFVKTFYDESRQSKDVWALTAGSSRFMWIEEGAEGKGFVLRMPLTKTDKEQFVDVSSLQSIDMKEDISSIAPCGFPHPIDPSMTILEMMQLKGKQPSLEKVGTVPRGTWVMAFSDGMMDCKRFDLESGKFISLGDEIHHVWEDFLQDYLSVKDATLHEVQDAWMNKMEAIVKQADELHAERMLFLKRLKERNGSITEKQLSEAWKSEIAKKAQENGGMYLSYDLDDDTSLFAV